MKIIVRPRDSGKARELLAVARDMKAVVASDNPERLRDKANRYGIYEVSICGYDDLMSGDSEISQHPIMIQNVDKFLEFYFGMSNQNIVGFSATLEEEKATHFTCPVCGKEWDEVMPEDWTGLGTKQTLCIECSEKALRKFKGAGKRTELKCIDF